MTKYKKPTYIIIQEAMAERIRFLEDELYERAYKDIEKLEAQNDFLKGLCNNQLEIIMDYEWKQMQEQATFIKANTRKWRARMKLRLKELREDLCISVKDMARDTGVSQNTIHLYERGGYPSIKQIEMIAKTYDVNPAWLVGWIDDEMMPGVQVVEKVVYKESPTARLPDYFNNNNDGKLIKWKQSRRYRGGRN